MDLLRWMDAVRPSGHGFVFALRKGKPYQISIENNAEACAQISRLISEYDVFVSMAKFQDGATERKKELAMSFRSVWIDIDCGNTKPFKNQRDAYNAFNVFCKNNAIPKPSVILNSGHGIHGYWCFEHAIDVSNWMQISVDLKALCFSQTFAADPAVMGDPARVMRVPNSYNFKGLNNPQPTKVLHPLKDEVRRFNSDKFSGLIKTALQEKILDSGNKHTAKNGFDKTTCLLMGEFSPAQETDCEIAKLEGALKYLTPDVARGSGSFYDSDGMSQPDYWLAAIWAIASLGWVCGKKIAEDWSKKSNRFTEKGFEQAWSEFNPNHQNPINIGSLYKRAKEVGWQESSKTSAIHENDLPFIRSRFNLLSFDEICQLPATEWLVKGILPSKGLASIYGPSGSGKTFLALDLLLAIAVRSDWFGFKVKNVPVAYVCLEGMGGITRRIQAWNIKQNTAIPTNFKIILDNFNLLNRNQVEQLAEAINQDGFSSGVIVIDTLNQASPTADENSSKDMGLIISHLKLLQELTNSLVLIIHHTGKNTTAGLRGHSSLKATLDTNIEVIGGDNRLWTIEKNKDGEDGGKFPFKLEVQKVGIDSDGNEITSCAVARDFSAVFKRPEPSGKNQKLAYQVIKLELANCNISGKCNSGAQTKCMKIEDAIKKISETLTTTIPSKRNYCSRTLIKSLIASGHINSGLEADEAWLWLP